VGPSIARYYCFLLKFFVPRFWGPTCTHGSFSIGYLPSIGLFQVGKLSPFLFPPPPVRAFLIPVRGSLPLFPPRAPPLYKHNLFLGSTLVQRGLTPNDSQPPIHLSFQQLSGLFRNQLLAVPPTCSFRYNSPFLRQNPPGPSFSPRPFPSVSVPKCSIPFFSS